MLLELLQMRDDGEPATVQERPPFDPAWSSDMFHFFCHMFYRERAFEDMYCFCLRLLDRLFVSMDADYADFNAVLAALRARLVDALAQRFTRMFRRWLWLWHVRKNVVTAVVAGK